MIELGVEFQQAATWQKGKQDRSREGLLQLWEETERKRQEGEKGTVGLFCVLTEKDGRINQSLTASSVVPPDVGFLESKRPLSP